MIEFPEPKIEIPFESTHSRLMKQGGSSGARITGMNSVENMKIHWGLINLKA